MLDLKGVELEVGHIILFPKGASHQAGVVLKFGNGTVSIVGIGKKDWYSGITIGKGRKNPLSLTILSEQEIIAYLTRYAQGQANAQNMLTHTARNPDAYDDRGRFINGQDYYTTFETTIEDYVEKESRRLIQMSRILRGDDLGQYEPINDENPAQYLPTRR